MIHTEDTRKTLAELAAESGGNYDTLYRKAKRLFPAVEWSKNSAVTPDQAAVLSGKSAAKKPAVREKAPAIVRESRIVEKQRRAWRRPSFGLPEFLAVVIYAHTGLVWYELAQIFVVPGIFAGVILAAMKHAAVVVTRSGRFGEAVHHALAVAFVLDVLAWYVHYRAFFQGLRVSNYITDMGQDSYTVAGVLAAVLCAGAFMSLFLIYKLKYGK